VADDRMRVSAAVPISISPMPISLDISQSQQYYPTEGPYSSTTTAMTHSPLRHSPAYTSISVDPAFHYETSSGSMFVNS
jgi:hypothetical protein